MTYLLGYVLIGANDLIEGSVDCASPEALPQDTFFGSPEPKVSCSPEPSVIRLLSVRLLNHCS